MIGRHGWDISRSNDFSICESSLLCVWMMMKHESVFYVHHHIWVLLFFDAILARCVLMPTRKTYLFREATYGVSYIYIYIWPLDIASWNSVICPEWMGSPRPESWRYALDQSQLVQCIQSFACKSTQWRYIYIYRCIESDIYILRIGELSSVYVFRSKRKWSLFFIFLLHWNIL
jgi:hypothetical protein